VKLPNGDRAVVDIRKLTEYALNPEHAHGGHKARVFGSALALGPRDAGQLAARLLELAASADVELGQADERGQRYILDFEMAGPERAVVVRSAWIVERGADFPRLISCFIPRRRGSDRA
jgi:hypothetical protein